MLQGAGGIRRATAMRTAFLASALAVAAAAAMLMVHSPDAGEDGYAGAVPPRGEPAAPHPRTEPISGISPFDPPDRESEAIPDVPAYAVVEDPDGVPVPHARLLIATGNPGGSGREYRADGEGKIRIHVRDSGPAGSPAMATAVGDIWTDPRLRRFHPGDRLTIYPLVHAREIRVFIGARPAPGAIIALDGTTESWTTDERGAATVYLPDAPGHSGGLGISLRIRAPGGVSARLPAATLPAGVEAFPVRLAPARSLAGTVVDSAGRPLASAEIIGENDEIVSTGEDGAFTLQAVPGDRPSRWLLRHPEAVSRIAVLPADAVSPLAWAMEPGPVLRATARDERGDPIPGIEIHATDGGGFLEEGVTDSDGRFDFRAPARARVTIRAGSAPYRQTEISLSMAGSDAEATLRLSRLGRFSARILDGWGNPVAGALAVPSAASGWFPPPRRTGDDGRVAFPAWPDGPVRVEVRADGFDASIAEVDPGAHHREWILARPPSALLAIHDTTTGMPAAEASFFLAKTDGEPEPLPAKRSGDRAGHFLVRSGILPGDGECTILVKAPGRRTEAVRVRPERAADPAPVFVELAAGRTLQGVVLDARSLLPVGGALVSAGAPEKIAAPAHRETVQTDGEGRFRISGLPDSPLPVRIEAAGYAPLLLDASAPADRILLHRGVPVAVVLAGEWPRDAEIHLRGSPAPGEDSPPALRPDEHGRARIAIPPGAWVFRIAASDARWNGMERSLELRDGDQGLVIFEPPLPRRLAGRIQIDPPGAASGLAVELSPLASPGAPPIQRTIAGDGGEFAFADVLPGAYEVSASFHRNQRTYRGATKIVVARDQPPVQIIVRVRE